MTAKPTTGSSPKKTAKGKRPKTTKPSGQDAQDQEVLGHGHQDQERLLQNIKARLPELEKLLQRSSDYLVDFKDLHLVGNPFSSIDRRWRRLTRKIFAALQDLMPDRPITDPFRAMVEQAVQPNYDLTRDGVASRGANLSDALTHGFFYLAVACNKARQPEGPPDEVDEGWETFLKIFGLE